MNTPTDKEIRDWYMGYGVEGRAELAEVEGEAFDRYLLERDAKVAKATEQRIIKVLEEQRVVCSDEKCCWLATEYSCDCGNTIARIKGENK